MTLIVMENPPVIGIPANAHLCDVILEALQNFVNTANDIKTFCDELRTLRKFLDLIDRVFKAKLPRMAFEEQHFTSVEVLLDTLPTLRDCCSLGSKIASGVCAEQPQRSPQDHAKLGCDGAKGKNRLLHPNTADVTADRQAVSNRGYRDMVKISC